jgi:hypothetical protein
MNLQSWSNNVAGAKKGAAMRGFFRQIRRDGLSSARRLMPLPVRARSVAVSLVWALACTLGITVSAQTNYYSANGTNYPVVGQLLGDQVFPDVAISSTNGIVVWQDNATDGDGWGISARRLDGTLSGVFSPFRVNVTGAGDQENARVAMLKNGGAVFVWQGGVEGYQHIFARFLTPTNTFLTSTDLPVSSFMNTSSFQINPAVASLNNSNIVVVWSSFNQAGSNSLQDVYAKILSPSGQTVSNEFLVNQFTNYNQRTPAVAALKGGGFVVTWVSEQEQLVLPIPGTNTAGVYTNSFSAGSALLPSVNIYARLYQSSGAPVGGEFIVDTGSIPCANPAVAGGSDGGFMIAWSGYELANISNSWDVFARPFSSSGTGGTTLQVNTYVVGKQFAPRLAAIGLDYLATWTSVGQDGARQGVYSRFIHNDGTLVGGELRANTFPVGLQMQPAVASDGVDQFLVVWSSFTGMPYSFDLAAQRYLNVTAVLQPMSAPFVWAPFTMSNNVYKPQLVVSWAPLLGLSVSNFEVYVDGAGSPTAIVTSNQWTMTAANGLTTNSTHSFQVDYVLNDGRRSPISPSASGSTWSGQSWGGIPFEWMQEYYGNLTVSFGAGGPTYNWPSPETALVSGGPNLLQVFLSGGSPLDSTTWLTQKLLNTPQGVFLTWNTQAGATYQVQFTTNLKSWSNLGSARFAAGATDSIYVGGNSSCYYRVLLLRQ